MQANENEGKKKKKKLNSVVTWVKFSGKNIKKKFFENQKKENLLILEKTPRNQEEIRYSRLD